LRIFFLIFLFSLGCKSNNKDFTNSYMIPKKIPLDNNEISLLPFRWDAPTHWLVGDKSTMRVASYLIPSEDGSADLSVIYLNGDGGGLAANVNRWRKQLNLAELTIEEIEFRSKNFIGELGKYKIYKIINIDSKESAFLCAIIPADDFTIFVKLNTYLDNINNLEEEFINFSSSFDYNE